MQTKLKKQGKLKKKRNKVKIPIVKPVPIQNDYSDDDADEVPAMKKSDLKFLKKAYADKSYDFLSGLNLNE